MDRENIKFRILRYIHDHPNAGDTIEGIVQWWIDGDVGSADVEEVVRELVVENELCEKRVGKRRVYGSPDKMCK